MSAARKRFTAALTVFILFSFAATPTSARDIRILIPYLGYISNACDNEEQDIELHNGGLEIIRLDMDAGNQIEGLDNFSLLNTVSEMLNAFFTRNLVVSFRMKYFEKTVGSNLYHIGGIAVVF